MNSSDWIRWLRRLGGLALLCLLGSCSAVRIQDVTVSNQPLVLEQYFAGQTRAYGIVLDRSGAAQRHFTVDIQGDWNPTTQTLTLDERFVFTDGERSQRIWVITKHAANHYTGRAADVVGTAQGETKGNALLWTYVLKLPYKGRSLEVNFEDWMFLAEDDTLINKATLRKFGFKVGEVLISFRKR